MVAGAGSKRRSRARGTRLGSAGFTTRLIDRARRYYAARDGAAFPRWSPNLRYATAHSGDGDARRTDGGDDERRRLGHQVPGDRRHVEAPVSGRAVVDLRFGAGPLERRVGGLDAVGVGELDGRERRDELEAEQGVVVGGWDRGQVEREAVDPGAVAGVEILDGSEGDEVRAVDRVLELAVTRRAVGGVEVERGDDVVVADGRGVEAGAGEELGRFPTSRCSCCRERARRCWGRPGRTSWAARRRPECRRCWRRRSCRRAWPSRRRWTGRACC